MEFTYETLGWTCACGHTTREVKIGTTSHFHLIGLWRCNNCMQQNMAMMPFEDLVKGIPSHETPDRPEWTRLDERILKQAHISL